MKKAKELLRRYNQEHIIPYLEKNEELEKQVLKIDFEELNKLCLKARNLRIEELENIQPINAINPDKLSQNEKEALIKKGTEVISENKLAVVTMAGGQGTRLGHIGPKGTFKITIGDSEKYLFQILADNLIREGKKYGVTIPWYIMTSKENNQDTMDFLKENEYFNYPKSELFVFVQEEMPLITTEGKLIIEDGLIKEASNGNGSIFASMEKAEVIKDMEKRGVEWIFIGSVDNILLQMVDPLLIGVTLNDGSYAASKTILKNAPNEKVGVFCKENGKVKVIEYTELPEKLSTELNEHGELLYGESHIMCNLFNIKALKRAATQEMQYHIATKNIAGVSCYKFEKFIFDAFNMFEHISILRGKREVDFAPIKNKEGVDSPKTAVELYKNYWGI